MTMGTKIVIMKDGTQSALPCIGRQLCNNRGADLYMRVSWRTGPGEPGICSGDFIGFWCLPALNEYRGRIHTMASEEKVGLTDGETYTIVAIVTSLKQYNPPKKILVLIRYTHIISVKKLFITLNHMIRLCRQNIFF
jgi:hypothetical protein